MAVAIIRWVWTTIVLLDPIAIADFSCFVHVVSRHKSSSSLQCPIFSLADQIWPTIPWLKFDHLVGLPPLSSIWTFNVTTYVTTMLAFVDDFLSWRTQFTRFIIMHQFCGMLDGSITQPSPHVLGPLGMHQPNLAYGYWLRVHQLIQAWLFAKISKDTLSEVRDLMHSIKFGNVLNHSLIWRVLLMPLI